MDISVVEKQDYSEMGRQSIERLKNGFKNKEGLEEIVDCEMGPDVRYVLSRDDISLVRRYLMGPITPAEYRELRFKLLQLQSREMIQNIDKERQQEKSDASEVKITSADQSDTRDDGCNDERSLFHMCA